MYIAKHYIETQKWIPAISRLKVIFKDYDKTIFIEEALFRLVEIHYYLGLEEEAQKYAKILGFNYNSSEWYEQRIRFLIKNMNSKLKKRKRKKEKFLK